MKWVSIWWKDILLPPHLLANFLWCWMTTTWSFDCPWLVCHERRKMSKSWECRLPSEIDGGLDPLRYYLSCNPSSWFRRNLTPEDQSHKLFRELPRPWEPPNRTVSMINSTWWTNFPPCSALNRPPSWSNT